MPIHAAISRASIVCHDSGPCDPSNTTSSPVDTPSMPVTSTVSMSMLTAPTIGARRPRTSTAPRPLEAAVEAVGVAGGNDGQRLGRGGDVARAVADALADAHPLHGDHAARQRHRRREREASPPAAAAPRRRATVPGRTRSPHVRESRRHAALLAACTSRGVAPSRRHRRRAASKRRRCVSNNVVLGFVSGGEVGVDRLDLQRRVGEDRRQRAPQVVVAEAEPVQAGVDFEVAAQRVCRGRGWRRPTPARRRGSTRSASDRG